MLLLSLFTFCSFKRRVSDSATSLPYKIARLNSQTFDSQKNSDDDDVIILEESSTPKPATECDITIVKVEGNVVDHCDPPKESSSNEDACSESKSSKGTTATQTEQLAVKKEEAEENATDRLSRLQPEPEITLLGPANVSESTTLDTDIKINELRIQLLVANGEKEKYQKQCDMYFKEVKMLKQKIAESSDKCVKKEMCHQSTETDILPTDEELENIKERSSEEILILYEQALNEIRRLKEQCNTLQNLKSECSKCSDNESKNEVDDMAVQLDDVFRQLDKCTIERDQYKSEVSL